MMTWQDEYNGDSKEADDRLIQEMAEKITRLQRKVSAISTTRSRARQARLERGFHTKGTGVQATFRVADDIPQE